MVLEEQPEKVIEALVLFLQGQVSIILNYFVLRQNKLERLSPACLFSLAQCLQLGSVSYTTREKPERAGSGLTCKYLTWLKRLVRGKRCIFLD